MPGATSAAYSVSSALNITPYSTNPITRMQRSKKHPDSTSTPPPPPHPRQSASRQMKPSPFSRSAFNAAADGSEQPQIVLDDWWLSTVEGHEGKISVGGFYEEGEETFEFIPAPLAKRVDICTLETEDGILVYLSGFFNDEQTIENGFTVEACEKFCLGFPSWWNEWKVFHPNIMSSRPGSQPRSSRTSNSHVTSASAMGSTSDENNVGVDNASRISRINKGCQKATVTSMRRQPSHDKAIPGEATDVTSSEKGKQPVGLSRKQRSAFGKLHRATESPNTESQIPYNNKSPLPNGSANSLSVSTPESLNLKRTKSGRVVVPTLDSGCQSIVHGPDGSICAIVGLDLKPELKGSTIVYARKKKKTC